MSDRIRRLLSLFSDAPPKPMSRREFLQRVGGAAALAAVPGKVAPPKAAPPLELLPYDAMNDFLGPQGVHVVRRGGLAGHNIDWQTLANMDKRELGQVLDSLRRVPTEAPGGGDIVEAFNWNTGNWHAAVLEPFEDPAFAGPIYHYRYLPAGKAVPDVLPAGFEADFGLLEVADGWGVSGPGLKRLEGTWRKLKTDDLLSAMERKSHQSKLSQNPEYRDQHVQLLRDLELAPGGRPDPQPVMGLDDDPLRRGSGVIPEAWNQRVRQIPFKKPGRGAIYAPAIGAALLAPQEEKK